MITGKVLDTSAVLDIATGESVYGQALLAISNKLGTTLAVPIVTLSAAWQVSTAQSRPWLDLMTTDESEPAVVVIPLDAVEARGAGLFAADAGRPGAPLGTVHAVHTALERQWALVTKDSSAALELSSDVRTETIP